jgi:outer membrane protein assembly factor BamB
MMTLFRSFVVSFLCLTIPAVAADWARWQGPNRDNKSTETGLLKSWPEGGPKMLWSATGLGTGWSSVSVAAGKIYTTGMNKAKQGELFAFDLSGKLLWKQEYGPEWSGSTPGARCTPTIDGGDAFVISGTGQVACFKADSGQKLWQTDAFKEYEGKYGKWGISEAPVVVDGKVIFTVGGKKATMIAMDRATGKTVWASKAIGDFSSYCSPLLFEHGGKKIIGVIVSESILGVDAANGTILWQYATKQYQGDNRGRDITPVTPIYHQGRIYFTNGYDCGGVMLEIAPDNSGVKEIWKDKVLDNHHGGVILHDGYIYGANWKGNDDGDWVCLEWATGKVMYQHTWINKGSVTFAEGMLYCYEEKEGNLALVRATPEKFDMISSFKVPMGDGKDWAHPVISDGVLYVRHGDALMAFDIKAK